MRKVLLIFLLLIIFAASSNAEAFIFKDAKGTIKQADPRATFSPIKTVIKTTTEAFIQNSKNQLWIAVPSIESTTLLYSDNLDHVFKEFNLAIGKLTNFSENNSLLHFIYEKDNQHYYRQSDYTGSFLSSPVLISKTPAAQTAMSTSKDIIIFSLISKDKKTIQTYKSTNNGKTFIDSNISSSGFDKYEEIISNGDEILAIANNNNTYKIIRYKNIDGTWIEDIIYLTNNKIEKLKIIATELQETIILFYQELGSSFWIAFSATNNVGTYPQEIKTNQEGFEGLHCSENTLFLISNNNLSKVLSLSSLDFHPLNPHAPLITINKPEDNQWFRPEATILFEAIATDPDLDLSSNPKIELTIGQETYRDQIYYYPELNKIFGFVKLPKKIANGKHLIEIEISDQKGNKTKKQINFSVDSTHPLAQAPSSPTGQTDKIILKFEEADSGIDLDSSIIKISSASLEVMGTLEANISDICFYPKDKLEDGKYQIAASLRDKAGNSGPQQNFNLIIKEGFIGQESIAKTGVSSILRAGPNPFSPERNDFKLFYTLSVPSEVKLFIFTINGQNIYRANSASSAAHTITWDGKDQFGLFVPNGVYLFALTHGESIQRGKIIVLR